MRKLKYVQLHDSMFVPGIGGEFPKTLPPSNKTIPGLEMYYLENGSVFIKWTGCPEGGVIGAATVKLCLFDKEDAKKPVKAAA